MITSEDDLRLAGLHDPQLPAVFRVRENLREGADSKDAVRSAVTRVGETITFSAC
jgi:hypothetical protein